MSSIYAFPKSYSLKSKKQIDHLFKEGRSISVYPLRFVYLIEDSADLHNSQVPIQLLISVSKKRFALAVHRNRLKRQCKEAFRTERLFFEEQLLAKGTRVCVAILYIANKKLTYNSILSAMQIGIEKMGRAMLETEKN